MQSRDTTKFCVFKTYKMSLKSEDGIGNQFTDVPVYLIWTGSIITTLSSFPMGIELLTIFSIQRHWIKLIDSIQFTYFSLALIEYIYDIKVKITPTSSMKNPKDNTQ